jgi:hypothetical protein
MFTDLAFIAALLIGAVVCLVLAALAQRAWLWLDDVGWLPMVKWAAIVAWAGVVAWIAIGVWQGAREMRPGDTERQLLGR